LTKTRHWEKNDGMGGIISMKRLAVFLFTKSHVFEFQRAFKLMTQKYCKYWKKDVHLKIYLLSDIPGKKKVAFFVKQYLLLIEATME